MDNNNLDAMLSASSWNDKAGAEIREFLQGYLSKLKAEKIGYLYRSADKGADNALHVYGFASREDYLLWSEDNEAHASLVLADIALPESSGSGAVSYVLSLLRDGSGAITTIDNTVKLRLRFTSQEFNPITQSTTDVNEGAKLTVQTRLNEDAAWSTKGSITIHALPGNSTDWTEVDITNMTTPGTQQVRLIAKGDTTELNTRPLVIEVTRTTLALTDATDWATPVTSASDFAVSYYVAGSVNKKLHLLIDGVRTYEENLGTTIYKEAPKTIRITDEPTELNPVRTHGKHTVEAWLSVGGTESEHVISELYVALDTTDTAPHVVVNNLNAKLVNWSNQHFLSFAVCKNGALASDTLPVRAEITNHSGTKTYMTQDFGLIRYNRAVDFVNMLEVDADETSLDVAVRFYSGDTLLYSFTGVTIDNRENFAPLKGYDLFINPRLRSNDEATPMSIVNVKNGQVIPSIWRGFGLQADGWQTDKEGAKCLRLLTGQSITINYEPFDGRTSTGAQESVTVELDVCPRSITNENAPLIQICNYKEDGTAVGFEMLPLDCRFLTQNQRLTQDQNVGLEADVRQHIALNIIRNLSSVVKGEVVKLNLVRIYVDGVLSREFKWEDNDRFIESTAMIQLGSTGAALDLYGLRIYKSALSSADVLKNYIASQTSVERKLALRTANDILGDDGTISYEKAKNKYPTIKWKLPTMDDFPKLGKGKDYKTNCEETCIGRKQPDGKFLFEYLRNWIISGQGTSSMDYRDWNQALKASDNSVWIDVDGVEHAKVYKLDADQPEAAKLVAKANFASSQQTHKIGAVNSFNDLWRGIMADLNDLSEIAKGQPNARVSVKQEPFLGFVETADGNVVFTGLYTFGAGKVDKLTFGYDKTKTPDYLMIEGADNGQPLVNHRIPWDDDVVYDAEGETWRYNGAKQFDFCLGAVKNEGVQAFKDFANFVYLNSPNIAPFVGDVADLQSASTAQANRDWLYWLTSGAKKYCLMRYDYITSQWVDAGINKAELNLKTDLGVTILTTDQAEQINTKFRNARIARFKAQAANHANINDALYHSCYILLDAASDNRGKNTYLYLDKLPDGTYRVRWAQDDLDTIFLTNNVGRLTKPYYVEPLDKNESGQPHWNASDNALYRLIELAFPTELRNMMNKLLAKIAELGGGSDPLIGFYDKYFFTTANLFPAVAYNETARIRYEAAALAAAGGDYNTSVDPLAQSLGSQIHAERQWLKRRLTYMSSFASYGAFDKGGDGALQFRSINKLDGSTPMYAFDLVPAQWLYPCVWSGSTAYYGVNASQPQRAEAGKVFTLGGVQGGGDNVTKIVGIDHYSSIGYFGDKAIGGADTNFALSGKQLVEFDASAASPGVAEFRPAKFAAVSPLVKRINLRNDASIKGEIDLSQCVQIEELELRGTSATALRIGNAASVTKLGLPSSTETLDLTGFRNLTKAGFNIDSVANVKTFRYADTPNIDARELIKEMLDQPTVKLANVELTVNWTDFPVAHLRKLAAMGKNAALRGTITVLRNDKLTATDKAAMIAAWGDIDSPDNALRINYTQIAISSASINGSRYITEDCTLNVMPDNPEGNTLKSIKWSLSANDLGASINADTGRLKVGEIGTDCHGSTDCAHKATITATITLLDGTTITAEKEVHFHNHECALGDYVFADGTFSDVLDDSKTPVGVCFYINPDDTSQRLMTAMRDFGNYQWGLYPSSAKLTDDPGYDMFDVTNLTNFGSSGISGNISDSNMLDATKPDGFKVFANNSAMGDAWFASLLITAHGFTAGTKMPQGKINTLSIITHRNKILRDSGVNKPLPQKINGVTEYAQLINLMTSGALQQYYYAAASLCFHYEPDVKPGEVLSDKFKAGQWFLPSCGELGRMCYYHRKGYVLGTPKAIFQDAVGDGKFTMFVGNYYWSSTENGSSNAWFVDFYSGGVNLNGKFGSGAVRAVAAF